MEAGRMYLEKGFHVGIVTGDRMNFKITTEFDMVLAELLLKDGKEEK
jgi:2-C-methyl-D-erythritol 4-phosphate cytidylyltransferase